MRVVSLCDWGWVHGKPIGARAWRLACEVCTRAVGSQVPAISVGCVTLKQPLVIGLHLGDVEHGRVTAQPLHVDLFAVHPLSVNGVGIVGLSRANDADLPVGCRGQIHGPLEVLHSPLFVAGHIAPDGHVGALGPDQRSALYRHHSLSHGNTAYKQEGWQEEKEVERMGK